MTIITVTQASTKADLIFSGVHVCWPLAHTITHLLSVKSRQGQDANHIFVGFRTFFAPVKHKSRPLCVTTSCDSCRALRSY
jgi:hypothetical protein